MLQNYLLVALRNYQRSKYYFALNILGLSLGITCFITLFLYYKSEVSYDTFFSNADRLYRITTYFKQDDQEIKWAITNGGLVPLLDEKVAGVRDATKCLRVQASLVFEIRNQSYSAPQGTGFYADGNFLDILDFPLVQGVDSTALQEPNSILFTERAALKYFNRTNVLGESVVLKFPTGDINLVVTGILKDIPENSHMQFQYLLSFKTLPDWDSYSHPVNGGFPCYVYFKTESSMTDSLLQQRIDAETKTVYGEARHFPIQRVTDIHFHASTLFEHAKTGNFVLVRIIGIVAIFVLIIAVINYVILSTSQSIRRSKEVAIRKTLGSRAANLTSQFLIESLLHSLISGCIALIMVEMVLRFVFPDLFSLNLSLFDSWENIPILFGLCILTGLLSGLFPAIQVSEFNVTHVLKGQALLGRMRRFSLRTVLVTLQFVFTISIMCGALTVLRQLFYLKTKDLGFIKEMTINISRSPDISDAEWSFFKEALSKESAVQSVGTTLYKFISDYNSASMYVIDNAALDTVALKVQWNAIDENLIPTLNMQIVEGRNFSEEMASDSEGIIINETARKQLGIGGLDQKKVMTWFFGGRRGAIIGVVKDFHTQSFEKKTLPIAFIRHRTQFPGYNLVVKLKTGDFAAAQSILQKRWKESGIQSPIEFSFIDDWVTNLFRKEQQLSQLIVAFAVVCIIICLLGLLGLVNFTASQKQKEMGIRKVYGATVRSLILDMNRYFAPLLVIAFFVAIPLSLWGIRQWLMTFAYKVDVLYSDFLIILLIFIFFIATAISLQSLKYAVQNPKDILGQE